LNFVPQIISYWNVFWFNFQNHIDFFILFIYNMLV
jgi:hypothetical protein